LQSLEQVVVLAGGRGKRLRPLTDSLPKPLALVAGQPFLSWQLRELARQRFRRILILVSYLGNQIEKTLGADGGLGLDITYFYEKSPLGTGGALAAARMHLDPAFFVINGDSFLQTSLARMEKWKVRRRFAAVMATTTRLDDHPVPANVRAEGGRVTAYQKGAGRANGFERIDAGVYLLERSILPSSATGPFALDALWPDLVKRRALGALDVEAPFYDIGTAERLAKFARVVPDLFAEKRNPAPRERTRMI
jgi:D-glycero-alpha-D-manno-heptose 1-phosphate guanylyltransferase